MGKEESFRGFLSIPKTFVPLFHFNRNFNASQSVVHLYHRKSNWVHVLKFIGKVSKGSFKGILHVGSTLSETAGCNAMCHSSATRPAKFKTSSGPKFSWKLPDDRPDDLKEFKQTRY